MTSLSRYAPISRQVRHAGWSQQIFEEIERRRVEPLQVVEEQCQRMVRTREHADIPPQHHLETASCILRREHREPAAGLR